MVIGIIRTKGKGFQIFLAPGRSADFKLTSPAPGEEEIATLRLCDDCLKIRKVDFGETFVLND